jgi:5-methylcytosine-specific restriction protein A
LVAVGSYCDKHRRPDPGSFADPDRGTRHARGYGSQWDKKRERILIRDQGLCQECLRNGRLTEVGVKKFSYYCDHIVPKEDGGSDDDDNLQALCRSCHTAKTDQEKNRGRRGGVSKP